MHNIWNFGQTWNNCGIFRRNTVKFGNNWEKCGNRYTLEIPQYAPIFGNILSVNALTKIVSCQGEMDFLYHVINHQSFIAHKGHQVLQIWHNNESLNIKQSTLNINSVPSNPWCPVLLIDVKRHSITHSQCHFVCMAWIHPLYCGKNHSSENLYDDPWQFGIGWFLSDWFYICLLHIKL